jgi:hypothetical protein
MKILRTVKKHKGKLVKLSYALAALIIIAAIAFGAYLLQHKNNNQESSLNNKLTNAEKHNNKLNNQLENTNTQLKASEAKVSSLTAAQTYVSGASCKSSQLTFSEFGDPTGLVGNSGGIFSFTNNSNTTCTLEGYPTFEAYSLSGQTVPQSAKDGGNYMYTDPGKQLVNLSTGNSAYFAVGWNRGQAQDTCLGPPTASTTYMFAKSTPPGGNSPLITNFHTFQDYCAPIEITAVAPLSAFNISQGNQP